MRGRSIDMHKSSSSTPSKGSTMMVMVCIRGCGVAGAPGGEGRFHESQRERDGTVTRLGVGVVEKERQW